MVVDQDQKSRSDLREEIRRLRRDLKNQSRQMSRKEQEFHHYLRLLSHELRTPLVSIQGFNALLLESCRDNLTADGFDFIEKVERNAVRMQTLLEDLALLSRVSRENLPDESVDCQGIVDEIMWELHTIHQFGEMPFLIESALPKVRGFREGLRHVFANLLGNAVKYSRDHVNLNIRIGCNLDELFLKFYVADNGVGIEANDRKKIFDHFVRAGNKRGVQGSGLGLAIAREIVLAHGGEIWVQSRKHRGSTFFFTLPAGRQD